MKYSIGLLLVLVMTGCGYRVVPAPTASVYLFPVDNRTERVALGPLLDQELAKRLVTDRWKLAGSASPDSIVVDIHLADRGSRTLQSGSDNRATVTRDIIVLTATIRGAGQPVHRSIQLPLLYQLSETTETHVDDRNREEQELAERMALQVAAWLQDPSIS